MAEQYVYTRSKSKKGSFNGFISRTEGIVGVVQKEIQTLALREPRFQTASGEYLPVWEKRMLSGGHDRVILQKTVYQELDGGMLQRSDGYVLDLSEELLLRPFAWGGLDYHIQDDEPLSLAPQPMTLLPLRKVLDRFSMSGGQLLQLVQGCFDALREDSLLLIEVNSSDRKELETGYQLLLWIYAFLPFSLRRALNCTTCYDGGPHTGCHLALMPVRPATASNSESASRPRLPSGCCMLFSQGRIEAKPAANRVRNSPFVRWLALMIGQTINSEKVRPQKLAGGIDTVYRNFDTMIRSLPEKDRCNSNYYDALCWNLFRKGLAQSKKPAPVPRDLTYYEDFLAFGSWPEVFDALGDILEGLIALYTTPASTQMIRLLTKILQLDGPEETMQLAWELFSAMLARDMEAAGADTSAVSAKYLRLMTDGGMDRSEALRILSRVFFTNSYPDTSDGRYSALWKRIGTSRSAPEGVRRCNDWMSSYANVCINAEELIDCADTVLRELDGFAPNMLERALKSLLGAQETRCYYARLEILPVHLTTCCQNLSQVWSWASDLYHPVIERYYSDLLSLLLREYARCWAGRSNLTTVCNLAETFRRDGWFLQRRAHIRELALTQCADICDYEWEQLKQQFKREDSGILQRLWQVLEFLTEFDADDEMKNLLVRQVCRYILHYVPDYVNDNWLVCEVRERNDIRREGYYLELLTLREFLQGKDQSLGRLQQCIRRNHVSAELMKDLLKFLYRLFQHGGLARLEPVALQGIFIACGDRLRVTQLDVFRTVCEIRGGRALIQMLRCWPPAPQAQPSRARPGRHAEASREQGAYPWLKTNQNLMEALFRLSQDRRLLTQAARGDETFCLSLAEAIHELAPPGSTLRPMAVRINGQLLALQEEQAGLKIRMRCSTRKRRLLSE